MNLISCELSIYMLPTCVFFFNSNNNNTCVDKYSTKSSLLRLLQMFISLDRGGQIRFDLNRVKPAKILFSV